MQWRINRITKLVIISFLFSNLFVKYSWAAKADPSPDFTDAPEKKSSNDDQKNGEVLDSLDVAQPPPTIQRPPEIEYFYPFSRALSARLGGVFDSEKYKDKGTIALAGFSYLYRRKPNEFYDFGFDLRTDSVGNISAERRWISGRAAMRPYVKAGFGLNLVPQDELATFLKIKNYQVRGAIGFEKIFITPMSFRYELELVQGDSTAIILSLGYSWAW